MFRCIPGISLQIIPKTAYKNSTEVPLTNAEGLKVLPFAVLQNSSGHFPKVIMTFGAEFLSDRERAPFLYLLEGGHAGVQTPSFPT